MNKKLYFDCETTGFSSKKNALIQLAIIIEIDGVIKEEIEFRIKPFIDDEIDERSLEVHGFSKGDIEKFEEPRCVFNRIISLLDKYINKFNKEDKFVPCGQNVQFDKNFVDMFFRKNGCKYFYSYIGSKDKDVLEIMSWLEDNELIPKLKNYKLGTIAEHFKIKFKAHDALEDIKTTYKIIKAIDKLITDGKDNGTKRKNIKKETKKNIAKKVSKKKNKR